MTIPAHAGTASTTGVADTLPFETPLGSDPLVRIEAALTADLSPKAFKLHTAVVLRVPVGHLFSIEDMAALSGLSGHQCRPLTAELVNAGLLTKRRTIIRDHGAVRDGFRYALAVTA
jgi:hypothetical protein